MGLFRNFLTNRLKILTEMDSTRIYVENVRQFLGVRVGFATWLCEKAARDGFFEKWVTYEHPTDFNIVFECLDGQPIDEEQEVPVMDMDNEAETQIKLRDLIKRHCYKAPIR